MSWKNHTIYKREDGSFVIQYNDAPYHIYEGGGSAAYPMPVSFEEVVLFAAENPDKVIPESIEIEPATMIGYAKSVNNVKADATGNISLVIPQGTVTSVNGAAPNAAGAVSLSLAGSIACVCVTPVWQYNKGFLYYPAGGTWLGFVTVDVPTTGSQGVVTGYNLGVTTHLGSGGSVIVGSISSATLNCGVAVAAYCYRVA